MLTLQRAKPRMGCAPVGQRARVLRVAASKGFGAPKPSKKAVEDGPEVPGQAGQRVKTVKFKGKRQMRQGPSSVPAQQAAQRAGGAQPGFNVLTSPEEEGAGSVGEQLEFEARLRALKAETQERQADAQRSAAAGGGVMGMPLAEEDIYASPPPLSKTLLPRDDSGAAAEYEGAKFGPSQAGLAVAAVLLGAVFLITSGSGDYAPTSSGSAGQVAVQQAAQLGDEQRAELEAQLAEQRAALEAAPRDLAALEASGVLTFRLGRYAEAEQLLARLAAERPGDAEVLRVLAEAQAAQGQWAASAGSYRSAWEASGRGSLEVLQGLVGALLADGKEAAAVEAVQAARAPGGSAGIGDVELALLAAKTYSQWRGHVPDALAVYDGLIQSAPEDFRAYLAKGLLLKDQGREGDATRYFIQAKYYAKGANRRLVDQIIDAREAQ